jgi:peptide deformylase
MNGIQAFGNAIYSTVALRVGKGEDAKQLVTVLQAMQHELKCPVLTAKHLGFDLQMFVCDLNFAADNKEDFRAVFINPELVDSFAPLVAHLEEDISLPRLSVSIERPRSVKVKYLNEQFKEVTAVLTDGAARAVQQGIDVLNGIGIVDRLNAHRQRSVKGHIKRITERKIETDYQLEYDS